MFNALVQLVVDYHRTKESDVLTQDLVSCICKSCYKDSPYLASKYRASAEKQLEIEGYTVPLRKWSDVCTS